MSRNLNNILYPYTCPHFEEDPEDRIKEFNCIHYKDLYASWYGKDIYRPGPMPVCTLNRKICWICVRLDDENHPKDADSLMETLPDSISDSELQTIRLNVEDFYKNRYSKPIEMLEVEHEQDD